MRVERENGDPVLSLRTGPRGKFVYNALLKRIRTGRVRPGDRLREEEIAETLGVSRTPVREALQHLQARHLVETAPGRGIVVVELNTRQVMELHEMREVLEGAAARFAAQHAMPAEIAMMRDFIDEFEAAGGDSQRLAKANNSLHRTIYEAARNRYMLEALNTLDDALSLTQDTNFSLPERCVSREHRAIVTAIEERDADAAEMASRMHIQRPGPPSPVHDRQAR